MSDNVSLERLTLGTAQLGLDYGIANDKGQPNVSEAHELLKYALDNGITTLDTARIYGNAEAVIGSFANTSRFTVISKFKLSDAALSSNQMAIAEAEASIRTSCSLLQRNRLDYALFHKDKDQDIRKAAAILPFVFEALTRKGLIDQGGISVYAPDELELIRQWEHIRAVQVPFNVFDTRIFSGSIPDNLQRNSVKVFARSIFLQGLLAMAKPPGGKLSFAAPYLTQLQRLAMEADRPVKDLAFAFVRDTPGVGSLVVGAETVAQLGDNIRLLQTPPVSSDIYQKILLEFQSVPEEVITPALWKK